MIFRQKIVISLGIPVGLPRKSGIFGPPKITTLKRAPYRHCGGAKIVILGGAKMTLFGHFLVSFLTPFWDPYFHV